MQMNHIEKENIIVIFMVMHQLDYTELEKISSKLNKKKEELGLFQEIKWTKKSK